MQIDQSASIRLAPRKRSGFVLTSLIDVIFLLLVFFMLSSQIAAFSLIEVSSANVALAGEADATSRTDPTETITGIETVFTVSRGTVRAGRTTISLDELPSALEEFPTEMRQRALVLADEIASVQDIATVLEAFRNASFAQVTLAGERP